MTVGKKIPFLEKMTWQILLFLLLKPLIFQELLLHSILNYLTRTFDIARCLEIISSVCVTLLNILNNFTCDYRNFVLFVSLIWI